jgi:hypothetical protein
MGTCLLLAPASHLTSSCLRILVSPMNPACPNFLRIISLSLGGFRDHTNFTSPAWDLLANERLPALTTLELNGRGMSLEASEGVCRLGRALAAVAGTLQRLTIKSTDSAEQPDEACYELGAAIGKLRRLRYLSLRLSEDGRSYHAVARGLAASGGCPELFELHVTRFV